MVFWCYGCAAIRRAVLLLQAFPVLRECRQDGGAAIHDKLSA